MIERSRLKTRGEFQYAASGGIQDATLLAVAAEYETAVSRKMVALAPSELPKRFAGNEQVLQTLKYDGEGVFLYFEADEAFVYNAPSGRVRLGFPALIEVVKKLNAAGVKKGLFRAELYLPSAAEEEANRAGVSEVIRVTFSGDPAEVSHFRLAVFDAIMVDGRDLRPQRVDFGKTWEQLLEWFGDSGLCHRAEGGLVAEGKLSEFFDKAIARGAEGLVIRRLHRDEVVKTKPQRTIDAVVLGFVEGEMDGKAGVASLLTGLRYSSGDWFQVFGRVGSGFTEEQRVSLLEMLRSKRVAAPMPMSDSDGRMVEFVTPDLIVQLVGEDLVSASGATENRTQTFRWDGKKYDFAGLKVFPRLTFARFDCFREDKDASTGGARIEQVTAKPDEPQSLSSGAAQGKTEVVRREVFVKGQDMVRKLMVIKQAWEDRGFPYVIYWTDWSAKRAKPLQVQTYFARSELRALALAEKLVQENVTRGFERLGPETEEAKKPEPKKQVKDSVETKTKAKHKPASRTRKAKGDG
ncbi:MAG: hypothetical protein ACFCU3_01760 [Verrucomicrobiales bacterium]